MRTFQGKSVLGGIAIGKVHIFRKSKMHVERETVLSVEEELSRFREATRRAEKQLQELYVLALEKTGEAEATIFEAHQLLLSDVNYVQSIETMIRTQKVNAEYAVTSATEQLEEKFANMEDKSVRERAADVKDISERVLRILSGEGKEIPEIKEPVIVVAEDLLPSETVQLDREKVLAFVTHKGSINSHVAILARTMGIPALVGVDFSAVEGKLEALEGKLSVVDGYDSTFFVEPEDGEFQRLLMKKETAEEQKKLLQVLKGKPNMTRDGREIKVYANVGSIDDVALAKQNDAGGIGLLRSEFLYLEKATYPSEEELFEAYKEVAEVMEGKPVIIRTLDIGADKQVDYLGIPKEENPAMGYRGIRICLDRPELFKTQLRALFRASVYGTLSVMYPMIVSVDEVRAIKNIVAEVKVELREQKVNYQDIEEGIMIETPAAVMMSEELAKEVDFFSIGTNDLTQYTLAADRQNPKLDSVYSAKHPAILKMIRMVVENAHKADIPVGICGELGGDMEMTEELLKMGVDELSVAPGKILSLRKAICECDLKKEGYRTKRVDG